MYLIWFILNASFIILFFALVLTLFSKGKQLFNNKYGNAIIVVFVVGVIGMLNAKGKDFDNNYTHYQQGLEGRNVKVTSVHIDESFMFDILLTVNFKKDQQNKLRASHSRSDISGMVGGCRWEYQYSDIDRIDEHTYSYEMNGLMHWSLFGIHLYTQDKTYKGTFSLVE